ncbi:hypothetical protein Forpe1208_v005611 [Fusarium oxysporum f. sp. rapae]|uniref:Uncharacterized protein n=1 Tax=Fusarium oxysporum f. sp. rapae TaxID=485398 RepID=A0A8J5U8Y1_FUSOX|nr:hypothetical protein Forpe1208_v005611 [Fusarium oxysporum f. sp. rapae]
MEYHDPPPTSVWNTPGTDLFGFGLKQRGLGWPTVDKVRLGERTAEDQPRASTPLRGPLNFARIAFLLFFFFFSPYDPLHSNNHDENRVFNMMQCLLSGPRNPLPLGAA